MYDQGKVLILFCVFVWTLKMPLAVVLLLMNTKEQLFQEKKEKKRRTPSLQISEYINSKFTCTYQHLKNKKEVYNSRSTFVSTIELEPDVIELPLKLNQIRLRTTFAY